MSERISHKYVDSHWGIFVMQGLVALFFGWIATFTSIKDPQVLIAIASVALLAIGTVEFANLLHREHKGQGLIPTFAIAITELTIAMLLLFTLGQHMVWHFSLIAGYTLFRGVFELVNALRKNIEATDRFAWLVCGIFGIVFGFAILNGGHLNDNTAFVSYFGTYLMIYGITNLFYGVHNRNEGLELAAEQKLEAENRKLARAKTRQKLLKNAQPAKATSPKSKSKKASKTVSSKQKK